MSRREQFEQIYEEEADKLFRFSLFRVSDRERAIDLVQESFARLWQKLASGEEVSNRKGFLYRTARNLIIDWYRKKKTLSLDTSFEEESAPDIEDERAYEAIEMEAEVSRVLEVLKSLPEESREVVYLRFVEDLKPQEIAELLGVNPNVVSIRITRGLKDLKKKLHIKE